MKPVALIGGNGDELDLCSTDVFVAPGARFGTTQKRVFYHDTLRGRRAGNVQPDIVRSAFNIRVRGDLDANRERVVDALRSTDAPVMLVIERADGTRRVQVGHELGDPPIQQNNTTAKYATIPVLIESADRPYWSSLEAIEVVTTIGVSATTPWTGQMPLEYSGTLAYEWSLAGYYIEDADEQTLPLYNDGPLPVWPEWTITGPATTIELAHERTGKVFSWAGTLATGETLKIVTDPDHGRTVRNGTDVVWDEVAADAEMSPLLPGGRNRVRVNLTGGVSPNTTVRVRWFPRYTSP